MCECTTYMASHYPESPSYALSKWTICIYRFDISKTEFLSIDKATNCLNVKLNIHIKQKYSTKFSFTVPSLALQPVSQVSL